MIFGEYFWRNPIALLILVVSGGCLYLFFLLIACTATIISDVAHGKNPIERVWVYNKRKKERMVAFEDITP